MSYDCTRRAALLFVGFLVVSPLFYIANVSKLLFLGRREQVRLPSTQQQSGRRLQSNKQFVAWNNEPATTRHQTSGRRLQAFDAATRQKQRRSYLGSLHPPVDASNLPRFLRDTLAEPEAQDIVFFWHIPKVRHEVLWCCARACVSPGDGIAGTCVVAATEQHRSQFSPCSILQQHVGFRKHGVECIEFLFRSQARRAIEGNARESEQRSLFGHSFERCITFHC